MIKMSRSVSQVRFIYVMTTIFLVGLSIFSFIQINKLFKSANLIHHTNHVKDALQGISFALMDAETNKRAFLLTRDSSMLAKRDMALQSLSVSQEELDSLISGNPEQLQQAVLLSQAIDERVANLKSISTTGAPIDIPDHLRSSINDGVKRMENVRLILDEMAREEAFLLEQRTQLFTRQSLVAPYYVIVLFLGALLILFFSYFKLHSELVKSKSLHAALVLQNTDREELAGKLIHVNEELGFQNEEKEKRASELAIANLELAFQNEEKEKRSSELAIANLELGFQNEEKEKRASELAIANLELAFQNEEKEKRSSELAIANLELEFQNTTKEKLAAELIIANHELAFQNQEKEKRASELIVANKELQLFLNISSHDLQEPLRKIQMAASRVTSEDYMALSPKGRDHFIKMQEAALSMQALIDDLLTYSRTNNEERNFENKDISEIVDEVRNELKESIEEKGAIIEVIENCKANVIHFQFRQLISNIISNALKFSIPGQAPRIIISSSLKQGSACPMDKLIQDQEYCHIRIADNGIGFDNIYKDKIFEVFQRLYGKETYKGTGIGLAIVKRIVENHNGVITATGELNKGATFDIYIPTIKLPRNG